VATARKPEKVLAALGRYGDRRFTLQLDVTSDVSVEGAVKAAVKRFGRIDILVNNAGYGQLGAFEELSGESINRQFETNVFGTFNVIPEPRKRSQARFYASTLTSLLPESRKRTSTGLLPPARSSPFAFLAGLIALCREGQAENGREADYEIADD
jgi:NAD(P)-dependent dehydrogenase (short-subunit alcohol dehydrogenase family)